MEKLAGAPPSIERYVILTDALYAGDRRSRRPSATILDWRGRDDFELHRSMRYCRPACATHPGLREIQGVVYSHRSTSAFNDRERTGRHGNSSFAVSCRSVPMFPATSGVWRSPLRCKARPGDAGRNLWASIYELLDTPRFASRAAVRTVWMMLLQHLGENKVKLPDRASRYRRVACRVKCCGHFRQLRRGRVHAGHDRDDPLVIAGVAETECACFYLTG